MSAEAVATTPYCRIGSGSSIDIDTFVGSVEAAFQKHMLSIEERHQCRSESTNSEEQAHSGQSNDLLVENEKQFLRVQDQLLNIQLDNRISRQELMNVLAEIDRLEPRHQRSLAESLSKALNKNTHY